MEAHMAYIAKWIPQLSPQMTFACRELRTKYPRVREG
jgi:hypothetical protein